MNFAASDLPALYRGHKLYLWVEDVQTKVYLDTLWRDPGIGFLVAGGKGGVRAVVEDARRHELTHVFGLRDRDFGQTNRSCWAEPQFHVFVLDALEIENLMLDSDAIATSALNTAQRTSGGLDGQMQALALPLTAWMACRRVLTRLREDALDAFPEQPRRSQVTSIPAAERWILDNAWVQQTVPALARRIDTMGVNRDLAAAEADYCRMLTDGSWRSRFSGKEIFGDLLAYVWTQGRERSPSPHEDFAKAIAEAQRTNNRVPAELDELHAALRGRI